MPITGKLDDLNFKEQKNLTLYITGTEAQRHRGTEAQRHRGTEKYINI
jgi:hypothetical protein